VTNKLYLTFCNPARQLDCVIIAHHDLIFLVDSHLQITCIVQPFESCQYMDKWAPLHVVQKDSARMYVICVEVEVQACKLLTRPSGPLRLIPVRTHQPVLVRCYTHLTNSDGNPPRLASACTLFRRLLRGWLRLWIPRNRPNIHASPKRR